MKIVSICALKCTDLNMHNLLVDTLVSATSSDYGAIRLEMNNKNDGQSCYEQRWKDSKVK